MAEAHFLESFFNPGSVAIVGLSRKAVGAPVSVLSTLMDYGYAGKVVLVNPNLPPWDGVQVFPDIAAIDCPIDLVVVSLPRQAVPAALRQCATKRFLNVIVITQGFADADEVGRRLQAEITAIKDQAGIRILGPNTIGTANAFAPFTTSFFEMQAEKTPSGLIAQSGLFLMGHYGIGNVSAGYGMAVDIGNGCDVGLVDALEFYERQEVIRVIQCHLESVENGRAFMEAAARVSRKKPVIVLKAGRSEAGQSAAASHSGAAAGEAQLYAAAFAKAGIVTAHSAEEMRMLSKAFCSLPLPQGKRVAVFSFSGGGAVLAIDALEDEGLELAELSPLTLEKIQAYFPDWMAAHNPLDVWMAVTAGDFHSIYPELLDLALQDSNVDAVLAIYASLSLPKHQAFDVSRHLPALAGKHPRKPILGWSYGLDVQGMTKRLERDGNLMVFPSLEDAARTLRKMHDYARHTAQAARPALAPRPVDHAKARTVLEKAQQEQRRHLFAEAFAVLEAYGFRTAPWMVAADRRQLQKQAPALGYPVAAKMMSQDVIHKSDVGGVRLGIANAKELLSCFDRMAERAAGQGTKLDGLFVQEMVTGGQEIILGAKNDPVFGPALVLGAGGLYTELLDDFAFAIAPIDEAEAAAMIDNLRFAKVLKGTRGQPACDLDAIEDMAVRLSQLICDFPEIAELDVNPVLAQADGAVAVDARIMLGEWANFQPS